MLTFPQLVEPGVCVHCGRPVNMRANGWARVAGYPVCHPNDPDRPDCYRQITIYHHVLHGCVDCARYRAAKRPMVK